VIFVGLVKGKGQKCRLSISIEKGRDEEVTRDFALDDAQGPAEFLKPFRTLHVTTSSSVNHPDEYGVKDYSFDDHWSKIAEAMGPTDEELAMWATLAVAAARIGLQVPEATMQKLIAHGYFESAGVETFFTQKTFDAIAKLVEKHLK